MGEGNGVRIALLYGLLKHLENIMKRLPRITQHP